MSSEALQAAYRLIREGRQQEAVQMLTPIVRAEPLNADAWWLLANALENQGQRRRALERVLNLRPHDEAAQKLLTQLGTAAEASDDFEVRSHRRSPLTILLALIALLTVGSCAACMVIVALNLPQITTSVQAMVLTVTFEPSFGTLAKLPTAQPVLPSAIQMQGSIISGQTVKGKVDTFRDDGWTFSGDKDQQITIELDAVNDQFDPHLYLYDGQNHLVAENDDIDGATNRNSRLSLTLTDGGTYTIRVGKFSDGGAYTLTLK